MNWVRHGRVDRGAVSETRTLMVGLSALVVYIASVLAVMALRWPAHLVAFGASVVLMPAWYAFDRHEWQQRRRLPLAMYLGAVPLVFSVAMIFGPGWAIVGALAARFVIRHILPLRAGMQEAELLERHKRGLCLRCGYDLAGNVSGVCPECGNPTPPQGGEGRLQPPEWSV